MDTVYKILFLWPQLMGSVVHNSLSLTMESIAIAPDAKDSGLDIVVT